MKLSIIIPTYNEEGYIHRCIQSIKKQTAKPLEIIVVDNNCADKTPVIAKKLGCRVVKETKKGISHARNCGAAAARGDVLCFIDADSYLSENWIAEVEKVLKNPQIQAATGLNIFENKDIIKKLYFNSYTALAYLTNMVSHYVFRKTFLAGNNLAIRKSVFNKLCGFEPLLCEDVWLSQKFWKLKNCKAKINLNMLVFLSSRGFETAGYLKTLLTWSKAVLQRYSQEGYTYKSKHGLRKISII